MAFQVGTPALGSLVLGWIAEYVGLQIAVGTGAVIVVVLTGINIRHLFRKRREIAPTL
jgi:hypothetical protein